MLNLPLCSLLVLSNHCQFPEMTLGGDPAGGLVRRWAWAAGMNICLKILLAALNSLLAENVAAY
jgi:hypothetical protein